MRTPHLNQRAPYIMHEPSILHRVPAPPLTRFDSSQGSGAAGELVALRRLMTFSRRFVRNLRMRQLPSRLDPQVVFDAMIK